MFFFGFKATIYLSTSWCNLSMGKCGENLEKLIFAFKAIEAQLFVISNTNPEIESMSKSFNQNLS